MMRKRSYRGITAGMLLLMALSACSTGNQNASDGTYVKPVEGSAQTTMAEATTQAGTEAPTESMSRAATDMHAEATTLAATEAPAETTSLAVIASGLAPGESIQGPAETDDPATGGLFEESDLFFTYKEKSICPGDDFDYEDYLEAWGSPDIEKGQACIGGGYDENYYFGEYLAVCTLGDSGKQIVYDIYISEEGYATAKGAVIGQTGREELHGIYGPPSASMGATDRYSLGDIIVSFTFTGGILSVIDYNNTK